MRIGGAPREHAGGAVDRLVEGGGFPCQVDGPEVQIVAPGRLPSGDRGRALAGCQRAPQRNGARERVCDPALGVGAVLVLWRDEGAGRQRRELGDLLLRRCSCRSPRGRRFRCRSGLPACACRRPCSGAPRAGSARSWARARRPRRGARRRSRRGPAPSRRRRTPPRRRSRRATRSCCDLTSSARRIARISFWRVTKT